nr:MAG TPA: Neurensin [Caudoviricetes sp.]
MKAMETRKITKHRATGIHKPDREKRLHIQLWETMILIVVGCCLLIAGFIVPPMGVIDSSVLVAFGEILTFAGTSLGIDYKYKSKKTQENR